MEPTVEAVYKDIDEIVVGRVGVVCFLKFGEKRIPPCLPRCKGAVDDVVPVLTFPAVEAVFGGKRVIPIRPACSRENIVA